MSQAQAENAQGQGLFETRRLAHTNLYVQDLDRTMRFYVEVLGLEEVYRTPLAGGGFVSNGNTHHDVGFITAGGPAGLPRKAKPGQLNHLGFELETEAALVASYEKALDNGVTFLRTADHDIAHSVYGSDPDGNTYELYADVVVDWRNQRTGTVTKAKPNWTPGSTTPVGVPMYHLSPEIRRNEQACFHPDRTTGGAIVTGRLREMVDYYQRIVGLNVLSRGRDGQIAVLAGTTGEPCLTLVESSTSRAVGFHHVSMNVVDPADLERSVNRAKATGVPLIKDVRVEGRRAIFVRDPDGFLIQFYSDEGSAPNLDRIDGEMALAAL